MINIAYVANPEFAVRPLEELFKDKEININLVISQKDKTRSRGKISSSPVKIKAEELGLKIHQTDDINSKESLEIIKKSELDYIVVVAFGQKIGDDLLNLYKDKIVNIHASLLPKYRGASPIHAALLNGDEKAGVSIMLIDKEMDSGDVLSQASIMVYDSYDFLKLNSELSELGSREIVKVIKNYDTYYKNREKQDNKLVTFTKKIYKEMGKIDFSQESSKISNYSRALSLWPKMYFVYKDQNIKIGKFKFVEKVNNSKVSLIFKVDNEGIWVNCKDKTMIIEEVQFPNKKLMRVEDYIRGNDIELLEIN